MKRPADEPRIHSSLEPRACDRQARGRTTVILTDQQLAELEEWARLHRGRDLGDHILAAVGELRQLRVLADLVASGVPPACYCLGGRHAPSCPTTIARESVAARQVTVP
jgi:hypothetical protein